MGTSDVFILIGMILMGICVLIIMPKMMMITHRSEVDYEKTVSKLVGEINIKADWKVTNEFDYQKNISRRTDDGDFNVSPAHRGPLGRT